MLTRLLIKNFKSFEHETEIDFTTTNYKFLLDDNTNEGVLKGAIFIGANASGKTNVIKAIKKILDLLFADKIVDLSQDRCIFSKEESMVLEYEFKIEDKQIVYHIEYNLSEKILKEKLYLDNEELINRLGSTAESRITENILFTELDGQSLIVREIYFNTKFRGHDILRKWMEFLYHSIFVDAYLGSATSQDNFSLGLTNYLEINGVGQINEFFDGFQFEQNIEYAQESIGRLVAIRDDKEKHIFFKRKGVNEPIPYNWESLGNKNLLNLLPVFFHVINENAMLIIDEFSSGFHNSLEELLIRYFMKKSKKSQLFLVTHSTNLLTNSLLRPDQIYTVTFDSEKGSWLKRVSDEKPREGQNVEKMYLSGVFGGVPLYKEVDYED